MPCLLVHAMQLHGVRDERPCLPGFVGRRLGSAGFRSPSCPPPLSPSAACSQNFSKKEPHGSTSTGVTPPPCRSPLPSFPLRRARPSFLSAAMVAASCL